MNSPNVLVKSSKVFTLVTFFDGTPQAGGAYFHRLGILRALRRLEGMMDVRVIVVCDTRAGLATVQEAGLQGALKRRNMMTRAMGFLASFPLMKSTFGRSLGHRISPWNRYLTELGCDLVFFTAHDNRAAQLYTHSYIFTVFDVCHLEHPEFPEVAHFGEFERREELFQRVLRKATAIITDSRMGQELVARYYGVSPDRTYSAPFLIDERLAKLDVNMPDTEAIREQYGIVQPYIFYPAQFWQHKNHKYIIDALAVMVEKYEWTPQAVFSGSDKGCLQAILEYADARGVRQHINYCGFVPSEHMPHLYKGAMALVMPTYFGPSNIPPMEACAMGVPVCYSDTPAFREQLGDAAYYVDLMQPESLAKILHALRNGIARSTESAAARWREHLAGQEERYAALLADIIGMYRRKILMPGTSRG